MVIAGSSRYIGAAYLACMGAARAGAGLVTLAAPESLLPVFASKLTEATFLPLPERDGALSPEASELVLSEAPGYQALLAGCGLGQSPDTSAFLRQTLLTHRYNGPPMVLDADALNILSVVPEWWLQLRNEAVVTPHPGEMSRLTGTDAAQINSDRLSAARRFAAQWDKNSDVEGSVYGRRLSGRTSPGKPLRQSRTRLSRDRGRTGRGHCGPAGPGRVPFRCRLCAASTSTARRGSASGRSWERPV